jgi:hypothetical protein
MKTHPSKRRFVDMQSLSGVPFITDLRHYRRWHRRGAAYSGEPAMDFDELFANVCDALRREQRISYRALRRRFELSDDDLEDLKVKIIEAKHLAVDENDRILVWIGDTDAIEPITSPLMPESPFQTDQPESQSVDEITQTTSVESPSASEPEKD